MDEYGQWIFSSKPNVHEGTNIQSPQPAYTSTETSQTQAEMQQILLPLSNEKYCLAPIETNNPSNEQFIELIVPDHEKRAAMESILTKSHNGSKVSLGLISFYETIDNRSKILFNQTD